MTITTATLAGIRATSARASISATGPWYADASLDGEHTLAGPVELVIADLKLQGTVLSGGPQKGRSSFRIVAGGGGWGKIIKRKSYATDSGVKASTVLTDAANDAGEKIDQATFSKIGERIGPAWTRREDQASRQLELLAPANWYVGEDGVTRIGRRPSATLPPNVTRITPVDRARGSVELASESIATILPGVVVDGLAAVDVEHVISKAGLRSTVWGPMGSGESRRQAALRKLFLALFPDIPYRGFTEYRVVTQEGERLNLQPIRVSMGMPDLPRVPVRPGIPGAKAKHTPGARVLVGFINADPARPFVAHTEDAESDGFKALELDIDAELFVNLGAGLKPVILAGDLAGIWPCVPTQVKVKA